MTHPVLIFSYICFALAVAIGGWLWWRKHLDAKAEAERVLAGPGEIAAQLPAVDLSRPPVLISRSPLVPLSTADGPKHGSDEYARPHHHQAKHAMVGQRDPAIAARIEKTQIHNFTEEFERYAAEEGFPVSEHGPAEIVQPVRYVQEPLLEEVRGAAVPG